METKGFEKDEWSLFSCCCRLLSFEITNTSNGDPGRVKTRTIILHSQFPNRFLEIGKKGWQVSWRWKLWVFCVCADEYRWVWERNGVIERIGFASLGNRCSLIFWSCMTTDCHRAEGYVNAYALIISGMVTIRYFIYEKVLWNAFLLLETCFFCYYRTVFISCRHNSFIIQLHVEGTARLIQLMWVFLGHCNWWF